MSDADAPMAAYVLTLERIAEHSSNEGVRVLARKLAQELQAAFLRTRDAATVVIGHAELDIHERIDRLHTDMQQLAALQEEQARAMQHLADQTATIAAHSDKTLELLMELEARWCGDEPPTARACGGAS